MNEKKNIGINNFIDKNVIIHNDVVIGNNNKFYSGTIIYPNTKIGDNNIFLNNNIIGEFAVEAKETFIEKKFNGLEIGNNNYFHINNIIYNGYYEKTIIGNNNKFLSEVTIHHDNKIGNHVVLYPRACTAGLCTLMDYSTMGMNSSLQQKSVLGSFSMIGMGNIASHNIFPFYIYFNQKYQRFNKIKIPTDLNIDYYKNNIDEIILKLKNNFNTKIIDKYNLSNNIKKYIIMFLNDIKIYKI